MNADLLTLAEVALQLRVSHDTVYRWAAAGKLQGTKVGRAWRFDAQAIQNLVAGDLDETSATTDVVVQLEEKLDFRDLYENSPEMCLSVDAATGRILCCNATMLKVTGWTREEVIGRPVIEMYDPASHDRAREIHEQLRTTGEVRDAEMVLLTKEGRRVDICLNLSAVRDADGKVLYSRSVLHEIASQKANHQRDELLSSGLLESVVGDLSDAVVVIDERSNLVYLNRAARLFLEFDPAQTGTRKDLLEKMHIYASDGRTRLEDTQWPCARALRGEMVAPTELLFITNEGARFWMLVRCTPLRNAAGRVIGCVSVLHNMMQDRQRESQLRLTEFTVMQSPDAVFWIGTDGRVVYVNERACQSLGYTREELLQMSVPDFDPDVTVEKWPGVWAQQVAQKHFFIETRHRTKQGRVFPVEVLSSYIEFDGVAYAVAHVRDISGRRRVDAQLKESEARFQRAIAGSRDGIWDWDIANGGIWFSPQYRTQLGYAVGDSFGKTVDDWMGLLHPEDKQRVVTAVEQHLKGVAPYDLEYRMRMKSGEYHWYRVKGQAFWDEQGFPERMAGTTSDVTEQRRMLEVMEHRRRRKHMLIQHTPAAVAMFDREMRYIHHSDQWLRDYGLEGQSLVGRSHYEVFPDAPERWKEVHNACLRGEIRKCEQDCFTRDDGSEVWLEWAIHPWTDDDGDIGGIVMFTNVITQRIQAERALDQARKAAESANLAKSEFLANMSHEIRTPLTAILGFTNVLRDKLADDEATEICATIERNGSHLLDLINDILDLSKVEAGCIDVLPERCSLSALVSQIVQTLRGGADLKQLALAIDWASDLPTECMLDTRRVRQILINLLGNALKFTQRGSVTLQVQAVRTDAEPCLEIAVRDTGIGIPSDKLSCLFEAFSQIDSSTTRAQAGTGLGLCISRRLARLCGGDITVISEPGVGSTFTLRLPLILAPVAATAANDHPTPQTPGLTASDRLTLSRKARVLVADDAPDNRRLLDFILRKADFEPTFVEDGQQLVDRLSQPNAGDEFDVVLVDMQMPVLDGYDAVKMLRVAGCPLPLIALTANAMDSDRLKCLDAGCDDFLTKPIQRQMLLDTLRRWVSHRLSLISHS